MLLGGTARPKPATISCAACCDAESLPWSQRISTPGMLVASDALHFPSAIIHDQWKRYARRALRFVAVTSTLAPASPRAAMNAVASERNGSTRSSILLLFCAFAFAQVTQEMPLPVAMLAISFHARPSSAVRCADYSVGVTRVPEVQVPGSRFRVQGSRFKVQGSRFIEGWRWPH